MFTETLKTKIFFLNFYLQCFVWFVQCYPTILLTLRVWFRCRVVCFWTFGELRSTQTIGGLAQIKTRTVLRQFGPHLQESGWNYWVQFHTSSHLIPAGLLWPSSLNGYQPFFLPITKNLLKSFFYILWGFISQCGTSFGLSPSVEPSLLFPTQEVKNLQSQNKMKLLLKTFWYCRNLIGVIENNYNLPVNYTSYSYFNVKLPSVFSHMLHLKVLILSQSSGTVIIKFKLLNLPRFPPHWYFCSPFENQAGLICTWPGTGGTGLQGQGWRGSAEQENSGRTQSLQK